MFLPKLPCISPNWLANILLISSQHNVKSPTLLLKYLFNFPWVDLTMLVVLHPRCKTLFVHALTNFFLTVKTVVSTYSTNFGNGLHTSLNFNNALAYESSVGESTTCLQNPHDFLNNITIILLIRFLHFFLNNFCIVGFTLTLQSVMHLALTFFSI